MTAHCKCKQTIATHGHQPTSQPILYIISSYKIHKCTYILSLNSTGTLNVIRYKFIYLEHARSFVFRPNTHTHTHKVEFDLKSLSFANQKTSRLLGNDVRQQQQHIVAKCSFFPSLHSESWWPECASNAIFYFCI